MKKYFGVVLVVVLLSFSFSWAETLEPIEDDMELTYQANKLLKQQKYNKALDLLQRSLKIREKLYGEEDNLTLDNYEEISFVYFKLKDYDNVIFYDKKSLTIKKKKFGIKHLITALSYYNLGVVYQRKGDYPKALKYSKQALEIREELLGKEHFDTATSYESISEIYRNMREYKKALKYYKQALAINEKIGGKKNPYIATNYTYIGSLYLNIREYKKALKYVEQALKIREKTLGKEHPDTATSYDNISAIYHNRGKYIKALKYSKQALKIREKILGKEHSDTATNYDNIGLIYQAIGEYEKALKYSKQALRIREKILEKEHLDTATSYDDIGLIYQAMGKYKKALKYSKEALKTREKILGEEHPDTALSYNNIGEIYRNMGEYKKALKYSKQALEVREKILGKEHLDTAESYNNIGAIYRNIGEYNKALNYTKRALIIRKKILGEKHLYTAIQYSNIAVIYIDLGEYKKALKYSKQALKIKETILGKKHPETAISYHNISSIYDDIGEYKKALKYSKQALEIRKKVLGKEHHYTAQSYNSIGYTYHNMKEYKKALKYFEQALAIREKVLGKEHPHTATSYNNMGSVYHNIEEYKKALKYFEQALAINQKIFGKEHPKTAISYNNISGIYKDMKEYKKALKYSEHALIINEKILGKEHPSTARSYSNMCVLYNDIGEYQKAYHYAKKTFKTFLVNRDRNFQTLNNNEKKSYLNKYNYIITLLLKTAYLNKEPTPTTKEKTKTINQESLNAWINYKGSVFDSENAIATLYHSTKDQALKEKIDNLLSNKRYLAKLYQTFPKEKDREIWKKRIKTTEEEIEKQTQSIATKAESFKEQEGLKEIAYQDIAKNLKEDELYIDYAKADEFYYLFSLDKDEHINFVQIDKNTSKKIDELVVSFREDIQSVLKKKVTGDKALKALTASSKEKLSKLYELSLAKPLGEVISKSKNLIVSTDGALKLIPFEAMFNKKTDKYLMESKNIRYIPSGKELVRLYRYGKKRESKKESVIFANPKFSAVNIPSLNRDVEIVPLTPNTNEAGAMRTLFSMRFADLNGTKGEATKIESLLNKQNETKVLSFTEKRANEVNFMKVKQPKILHLATHGFFLNDKNIVNPMLKSGIALSGANISLIDNKTNGIVTALKLSGLDLKGTDLVVLSACKTGVVEIDSTDSVSGLGKAFIQAGAKDVVMSLWSVNDRATKNLMKFFYKNIVNSETKNYAKALREAKLKMIDDHPFYWAGFVINGL